jgi:pteridine reductase
MAVPPLAVVTGAARRLGRAFALTLARNGYAVLVHYWAAEAEANQTAADLRAIGTPAFLFQANLTDPASITALFASLDETPHPLRVLVNSAACLRTADPRRLTIDEWDETLNLNLRAPFLCAQQAAARMNDGGLIVNVTDVGARRAWSRFPAYSVSKAGLEALTGILARAFSPSIRVNAIAPGLVLQSEAVADDEWRRLVERLPLKRPAALHEIASALEFLLKNDYVTGQTLVIDGGYSLLG